jgi:hydroxymethylbilane synthase
VEPLRGNLDTRLRKLDEGGYHAIVLAAAGLKRLGLAQRVRAVFEVDEMIPCAGQGALGLEIRADDAPLVEAMARLAHTPTWLACEAERAVSRALGGSCSLPLAAHAHWQGSTLCLNAALGHAEVHTSPLLRASVSADVADVAAALALGREAADRLRALGAGDYLPA